jgi:hypothetical protein
MKKSPRRVVVQLTGGLGNQLFQLAVGLSVAKSDTLLLEQDLGIPKRNHAGHPDIQSYNLPSQVVIETRRNPSQLTIKALNFILRRSAQQNLAGSNILRFAASVLVSFYRRSIVQLIGARGLGFCRLDTSSNSPYLLGYFQSFKWVREPSVLSKMRDLKVPYSGEISKFTKFAVDEKPLVVHIRLGDYLDHPHFGIPSRAYYEKAIDKMWSKGDFKKIWLFSNDAESAIEYLPKYLHNHLRIIPEVEDSAAHTLEVMRMGYGYVIGNSTYSWWGAMLSRSHSPTVFAPNPWFLELEDPIDLIPNDWFTLPAFEEE